MIFWGIIMNYNFVQPLLKQSTKVYPITNEEDEVIGGIQRFYKSKIQFVTDFFFDGFFLNIQILDENQDIKVKSEQRFTIIKDSWEVHVNEQTYILRCITKIKTNPRYIFYYDNKEFLIFKDYIDKYIRIKNLETNKIVSEYEYKTLIPPRNVSIKILNPILDIHLSMCLYSIFSTKYS